MMVYKKRDGGRAHHLFFYTPYIVIGEYLVKADPTRLQQVFMNLAVNARDAMPSGGILHFELKRYHLGPDDLRPLPDLEPGDWICVRVRDTGTGIPAEILPHIFDPFFTTKPTGQGTGLGLAQVYGIVKQHGGCIDVRSQVGKGNFFLIYLPALETPRKAVEFSHPYASKLGSGETVLVVEDDRPPTRPKEPGPFRGRPGKLAAKAFHRTGIFPGFPLFIE